MAAKKRTVRVHGRSPAARREAGEFLRGCLAYMDGPGIGQICELFDGDAPHAPGGLVASARSVAEILRAYVEDVLDIAPAPPAQKADFRDAAKTPTAAPRPRRPAGSSATGDAV